MIIRATCLLPMTGPPISPGWLEIQNDKIIQIQSGTPSHCDLDLAGYLIAPGLIDCHCHLDYTLLRNRIPPTQSFVDWLKKIIQLKTTFSLEDYRQSILNGFEELIDHGTTTVLNIESFLDVIATLQPPIRTYWAIEGIDIKTPFHFPKKNQALSPHAPYTASETLYQFAKQEAEKNKKLFTTHVNESYEENEMFLSRSGKLYDFLRELGRDMSDCQGKDALNCLLEKKMLPQGALLTHCNYLTTSAFEKIKKINAVIVHCPETHAYFNRKPFPYDHFHQHHIPVVLGSDSLASASTLSLLANLQQFHRTQPKLSYKTLLRMVTLDAANALRQTDQLGCFKPGAFADVIAVPFSPQNDPYETMVNYTKKVPFVMSAGKILRAV
ncbi:MAG: amidohydrolase family protein [Verrucomicrobiae bacterium]|nr:amidohydrolase family protein [Verrucomicrobiae bacterium]